MQHETQGRMFSGMKTLKIIEKKVVYLKNGEVYEPKP
jgi:hypothetical protein